MGHVPATCLDNPTNVQKTDMEQMPFIDARGLIVRLKPSHFSDLLIRLIWTPHIT